MGAPDPSEKIGSEAFTTTQKQASKAKNALLIHLLIFENTFTRRDAPRNEHYGITDLISTGLDFPPLRQKPAAYPVF
jgi:hypothetical protein